MSDALKNIVEEALVNMSNCVEVETVEMKRVSVFSYGVFNPDEDNL